MRKADHFIDNQFCLQRDEKDKATILSGTEKGYTLGTPLAINVPNQDQRPHDYGEMDYYPRPSHADFTYLQKYGIKASSGGGRSSARETIGEEHMALGMSRTTSAETCHSLRPCRCRSCCRKVLETYPQHRSGCLRIFYWERRYGTHVRLGKSGTGGGMVGKMEEMVAVLEDGAEEGC